MDHEQRYPEKAKDAALRMGESMRSVGFRICRIRQQQRPVYNDERSYPCIAEFTG
jgi:hypothetical protein